ncbi:MAG TPA: hypothetical protein VF828_03050 [Patescibacteria group bacterium]
MPAAKKKEISLLPESENTNSFISKSLKWLLTVGRVVIVLTEFVVICAFASRFVLDRKNSDISDVIRQQKAIIESVSDFEKEYASLQKRLKVIKDIYANQPDYGPKITSLVQSTPTGIIYENLRITNSPQHVVDAQIQIKAYNEDVIVSFITNLVVNPDIASVDVRNIEKKSKEAEYSVTVNVVFKSKTK